MRGFHYRLFASVLVVLLAAFPALSQQAITVGDLVHNPERYDKQIISVAGTIADYRERVSERGNPYTTFRLQDAAAAVAVFAWKHQGLSNGLRVRVVGTFSRVKRVGGYIFYNEIEVRNVAMLKGAGPGPTALCNDGTYSYAVHHQGACSHHGGVAQWYR